MDILFERGCLQELSDFFRLHTSRQHREFLLKNIPVQMLSRTRVGRWVDVQVEMSNHQGRYSVESRNRKDGPSEDWWKHTVLEIG
jgi:hypothetical protein